MNKYIEKQMVREISDLVPLLVIGAETGMFYRAGVDFSVGEAKMPSVMERVS